jgi:hypothetical protein
VCYTTGVEYAMIMPEDEVQGVMITSLPGSPPPTEEHKFHESSRPRAETEAA